MYRGRNHNYKAYHLCRFCKSRKIIKILDLGLQPLAGGFLRKKDFDNEKFYPLELYFCQSCYLVQTSIVIKSDVLFKNYFYYSSAIKTLTNHFLKNADLFVKLFKEPKNINVLEIGCNDGSFIRNMIEKKINVLGIDPAKNIVGPLIKEGVPIINDYFSTKSARLILKNHGKMNLIVSTNTLAHITDMHDVVSGIAMLLKDNGFLYFENHYLGNLISENQYDMVYHEHQYYYSLLTLINFFRMHDMEIFNLRKIPIHGGSIGFFVQKKPGKRKVTSIVKDTVEWELKHKLNRQIAYTRFGNRVKKHKNKLSHLTKTLKTSGKIIAGYGASGRGTIITNSCNLGENLLSYIIDDSTVKQGLYTPGKHIKIIPSNLNQKDRPDYTILFAWTFLDEIKKRNKLYLKNGGKFIIPLPEIKII